MERTMKPKDLKSPFTWEKRRPLICDQVLYVPDYYHQHAEYSFPGWETVFGRAAPVEVEFCAGNGAWIVDKAKNAPERNWVAVEWQFDRVRQIWSKMRNGNVTNLFIVCGEALTFTTHYLQTATLEAAYINFPDPWPKEKHTKHRLVQAPFLQQLARVLKGGSPLTIATDHAGYVQQMVTALEAESQWRTHVPAPHYVLENPGYGTSYFDALWRSQGLPVHYIQYERVGC
jgi:tRNA (guanine-N7-)-methyltransferase